MVLIISESSITGYGSVDLFLSLEHARSSSLVAWKDVLVDVEPPLIHIL